MLSQASCNESIVLSECFLYPITIGIELNSFSDTNVQVLINSRVIYHQITNVMELLTSSIQSKTNGCVRIVPSTVAGVSKASVGRKFDGIE